jgi:hypothetical protein
MVGENETKKVEGMALDMPSIEDEFTVELRLSGNLYPEGFFNSQQGYYPVDRGAEGADAADDLRHFPVALSQKQGLEEARRFSEGELDTLHPFPVEVDKDPAVTFDAT